MQKILKKVFVCGRAEKAKADDSFLFIASDETVDRYGDVVKVDGWDLSNFHRNPIVLWGHDPMLPIGTAKVSKREKQLVAKITFASTPAAQEKRALVEEGVLRAVSVGFAVNDDGFEPREGGGYTFTSQELLEISLVSIPANAGALLVRLFTSRESLLRSALRKVFNHAV